MLQDALADAALTSESGDTDDTGEPGPEGARAVTRRARLDAELVRRGLARSREQAAELVAAGRVRVAGPYAVKPATQVDRRRPDRGRRADAGETLRLPRRPQAGRRARRLRADGLAVAGRRALDAGASTGGFTDVLLRARRRAGGRRRRRLRPARLVAADRRPGHRHGPHQRPRADARRDRASRSTWSSPTCPSSRCAWCCPRWCGRADAGRRPGADGQAAVRGRPRARSGAGGVVREPGAAGRGGRGGRGGGVRGARAWAWRRDRQPAARAGGQRRVLPVAAPGRAAAGPGATSTAQSRRGRRDRPSASRPARRRTPAGPRRCARCATAVAAARCGRASSVRVLADEAADAATLPDVDGRRRDAEQAADGLRAA